MNVKATIIKYEHGRAPIVDIGGVKYRCVRLDPSEQRAPSGKPPHCACGCGELARRGNSYINGHQNRGRSSMQSAARQLSRERSWERFGRCEATTKSGTRCRNAQSTFGHTSGLCIQHIRAAR